MKFKEITFTDKHAERIYASYINRIKNATKNLNKESQTETLLEINSHIYEALVHSGKNELDDLLNILESLGEPEIFLKELVAEKQLEEAARSFNPVKIIRALLLNITNGISYFIFLILYLSLFSFVFLIVAKIIDPSGVGLFYKSSEFFVLGKISDSHTNYEQYEQLGNWFIPLMIAAILLFYTLITFLLKLKKIINKK